MGFNPLKQESLWKKVRHSYSTNPPPQHNPIHYLSMQIPLLSMVLSVEDSHHIDSWALIKHNFFAWCRLYTKHPPSECQNIIISFLSVVCLPGVRLPGDLSARWSEERAGKGDTGGDCFLLQKTWTSTLSPVSSKHYTDSGDGGWMGLCSNLINIRYIQLLFGFDQ